MRSVPYSCEPCRKSGWPTALLVFGDAEPPVCRYHDVPMVRSRFYDENGYRISQETATTEGEVVERE